MRTTWIKIVAVILMAGCWLIMPESSFGGSVSGVVKRPAKLVSPKKAIRRYRGAGGGEAESGGADCQCNPALFAVVSLTPAKPETVRPLPDTLELSQRAKVFEPSVLAVSIGSVVSFPNLDPFYHNVFSYSKTKKFDLGKYPEGDTRYVEFDKPGIAQVFCEIHFSMRAYVHVLETNYFAVSDQNGKFVIKDVPPGEYTARVWQEGQPEIVSSVMIDTDSPFLELE